MPNPLLEPFTAPFSAPPFADIRPEHFRPAFEAEMAEQKSDIEVILADADEPSFANTIVPLEKSGLALDQVASIFGLLSGADTNDALQAIEREMSPVLARHSSSIWLNEALFARVDSLHARRDAIGLGEEERRVVERYHTRFVRRGAKLDAAGRKRLAEIKERLATLGTLFSQNILADEKAWMLALEPDDLAGLPDWLVADAAQAASDRGIAGKHVITLSRSSIEPFLQFSTRRDLREKAFAAWIKRGENGGANDNRAIMTETMALRAERARLLGYDSYAAFRLADTMARMPEAALGLLNSVWEAGRKRAAVEAEDLQSLIAAEGQNFKLAPWDWRHYAEKIRKRRFDFDSAELKPYLQLESMIAAAFDTAGRLFGLALEEVHDVPVYHPDVRVWKVTQSGRLVGLFLGD